ncbi:MAG: low molecular weight phosphotyrosine protein phosphatase [Lachnospiraceae bacterium]|nr:low molecular weight phosphotyrosine protein phosphatase [Lachnospiraceae bacterium]
MIKVLFICTGNICRSPMAEFIFKDMLTKKGLDQAFFVASAATSSEEIYRGVGNPVYPPARKILAAHGLSCEGKRAVQLRRSDYEKYDYLICMDRYNIQNARIMLGGDPQGKLHKLMEYAQQPMDENLPDTGYTRQGREAADLQHNRKRNAAADSWYTSKVPDVADPWYTGDFETAYRDIVDGCEGFLRYLEEKGDCS